MLQSALVSKQALISVSDKSNLEELLKVLKDKDYSFVSTGGTAKVIREAGFEVKDISELTGFPEMLEGRVKTLHPKVHGGLLAKRDDDKHLKALSEHGIETIDLVIVNLYPFEKTINKEDCTLDLAIENIDIGGPSMLRSAAKNYKYVTVVSDSSQYKELIKDLEENNGKSSENLRERFAKAAFARTAEYDAFIANFLNTMPASNNGKAKEDPLLAPALKFKEKLRYGENPHQKASLYSSLAYDYGVANAEQLQGKELSFNNYMDIDAAWSIVSEFDESVPCVSIIKHTNPCGVAIAPNVTLAFREAFLCDTISAFGGIIASNKTIDLEAANEMTQIFLEAIIAPDFTEEALKILSLKKNLRVLKIKTDKVSSKEADLSIKNLIKSPKKEIDIKAISGGFLVQDKNNFLLNPDELKPVTKKQVDEKEWIDLLFAWKVVKHVKSNAIVAVKDGRTIGIGVGQTSRVAAVELALKNTDMDSRGCVLASDAFFPFKDNIEMAAANHVSAIIQPGGSKRDDEVIKACDELGIAMVMTGYRHFKH